MLAAERARRKELGLELDDDDAIVDLETGEVVSKKDLALKKAAEDEEADRKRIEEEGAETAEELFEKLGVSDKEMLKFEKIYKKIDGESKHILIFHFFSFPNTLSI